MKILQYALPIAFALLITVFITGMPDLRSCPLYDEGAASSRGKKPGAARMGLLLVTLAYSVTAFVNLGDMSAPETFLPVDSEPVILELESERPVKRLALYCGVGMGEYALEHSDDRESWQPLFTFNQGHVEVLKWNYLDMPEGINPKYIRLYANYGNAHLGEAAAFDENGGAVMLRASALELSDEQDTVPASMNFMNSSHFDEIYHARTAWEHLNNVYPYEVSHPPLGKLLIAFGTLLFGMTPFGWRFSGTLFGCLMLPVMYAFIKRLFKNEKTALLGTIVFAADFMHFTQTRIATIDTYGVFFILLMYYFMYIFVSEDKLWALALSGVFFGLGAASKWTCLYAGAGLAVIWLAYWVGRLRADFAGNKGAFLKNVGFCLCFFLLLPALIYYLSYYPYGSVEGCLPFTAKYTKIVLENQRFMFSYHSGVNAEHPYSSRWYQWILNIRPILYYLEYFENGSRSSIASFLSPITCWGGLVCLFPCLYMALFRRDRRAAFILLGWLAQLLPWVFIKRLTFEYHYFPCSVFLVLSIAYVFDLYRRGRKDWLRWCVPAAAAAVLLFVLFYPVLSGAPYFPSLSRLVKWLPTWPL